MENISVNEKRPRGRPRKSYLPPPSAAKFSNCSHRTAQNEVYVVRAIAILQKHGERFAKLLSGRNKTLLSEIGRLHETNLLELAESFIEKGVPTQRIIYLSRSARVSKTYSQYESRYSAGHPTILAFKIHTIATRYKQQHLLSNSDVINALALTLEMLKDEKL